ncbi:hypothetical protein [Caulobacter sp. S45]|nr:hypothetical protein [Caulobacter sp. S45]
MAAVPFGGELETLSTVEPTGRARRHASRETRTPMTFSVFTPAKAEGGTR